MIIATPLIIPATAIFVCFQVACANILHPESEQGYCGSVINAAHLEFRDCPGVWGNSARHLVTTGRPGSSSATSTPYVTYSVTANPEIKGTRARNGSWFSISAGSCFRWQRAVG